MLDIRMGGTLEMIFNNYKKNTHSNARIGKLQMCENEFYIRTRTKLELKRPVTDSLIVFRTVL